MLDVSHPYFDSNLSWLSYNHRLLIEANDETVPVLERLRFLGQYAKQMNEFMGVKIPLLRALELMGKDVLDKLNIYPTTLLEHIQEITQNQREEFEVIFTEGIVTALASHNIKLYYKEQYSLEHQLFCENYFTEKIFRYLQPVLYSTKKSTKGIQEDKNIFHIVARLSRASANEMDDEPFYGVVNIPCKVLPRYLEMPTIAGVRHFTFIEDIIKANLPILFPGYQIMESYTIELVAAPNLELEDEFTPAIASKIAKQLEKTNFIPASPFYHEYGMPLSIKNFLEEKLDIPQHEWVELGDYIRLTDLLELEVQGRRLSYPERKAIHLSSAENSNSIFEKLNQEDILLHLPHHSYLPILKLFNEAAIDPFVREIHVSLYKISANTFLVNSLITAARNGKKVIAFIELNTRFDIQENIHWAKKMKDAGVKLIFSTPGLKVHAKVALIKRKIKKGWERYGFLGTGGFYKLTARELTDHAFITTDREICNELELLFAYLATGEEPKKYKYLPFNTLLVTQFNAHRKLIELIDREIKNSKMGKPASIIIKINQLQDKHLIDKLYHAVRTGVSVTLLVTNCITVIPDLITISEGMTVLRIVDRYEENTRIFYFHNDGQDEVYLSSGDWTFRNFQRRIDVCFPIYNPIYKGQLKQVLKNYINDNYKAVKLDIYQNNIPVNTNSSQKYRAQELNYKFIESLESDVVVPMV